ncbi:hypothetical protein I6A60_33155 [Frankia sp. AgB1.9]|uniref:hypothetical protein n=1 Tax=unclassified Frankia TaxID=2632575 RepID=UPI001933AB06|nr:MULTISPECIES: hypothetical protein [unclassified Frankia]MBL7489937.1 hypothetical protein [Frankia sp. AgW1.1]MBL7552668.1 hypothetical protein [Frankia sp. AgB1.9]MBL7623833.1 hypothetical protein [Frankia sp. AgB1.8]
MPGRPRPRPLIGSRESVAERMFLGAVVAVVLAVPLIFAIREWTPAKLEVDLRYLVFALAAAIGGACPLLAQLLSRRR